MAEHTMFSTKEAAERLNVHARTVRKWIDAFSDYVRPQLNQRGHYQLTETGLQALQNIQTRIRAGNKSLKQVREELVACGELTPDPSFTRGGVQQQDHAQWQALAEQVNRLESVQQETLHMLQSLHHQLEDARKKQDQLKFEIRNATFDQRLQAADEGKGKRKKAGVLRLSQLFR